MKFGQKVKELRKKHNMTQDQLARALDVSTRTIQSYERGQSLPKSKFVYEKLSSLFNINIDYLVSDGDPFVTSVEAEFGPVGKTEAEELVESLKCLFAGGEMSEEDMDVLMFAVQEAYVEAKRARLEKNRNS